MNFCSNCGAPVTLKIPHGDHLPRHVCEACSTIHYSNPKMVIGCIAQWEDRVLLCKRAIEPRAGLWTLPAGFMENGETTAQAALRETLEEANARVELAEMFTVLSVPYVNQVHIFYRGRLLDLDYAPGAESLEVALFREDEIPWKQMAFRTVTLTLEHFYADRRTGTFRTHAGDIHPIR
ncbi:MAG: NUDIX hydrolase [Burkholderiales bacterium]|nr:NUDIX hydrolase [Burkholderiales bacterium]